MSSSRDPPNPGTEPRSSALQAGSLPSKPPGKPLEKGECFPPMMEPMMEHEESLLQCLTGHVAYFMPDFSKLTCF